jgi:hypothetical protein
MAVVFPVSDFFPVRRFYPVRPGSGQVADSGMSVRLVLAGRLYETLAIFSVSAVCSCRKDVSDSVCVSAFSRRESALFGERLPVVTGAGFRSECLYSVRAAMFQLATCPDACFSGLFLLRGWIGKSRDGLSGYRQAGCFAIGRNPVRSSVPVLLSVIFLCLDKACLAKWFMLEGPGLKVFCGKNDLDIESSNAHCIESSTVCFYHRATNV